MWTVVPQSSTVPHSLWKPFGLSWREGTSQLPPAGGKKGRHTVHCLSGTDSLIIRCYSLFRKELFEFRAEFDNLLVISEKFAVNFAVPPSLSWILGSLQGRLGSQGS